MVTLTTCKDLSKLVLSPYLTAISFTQFFIFDTHCKFHNQLGFPFRVKRSVCLDHSVCLAYNSIVDLTVFCVFLLIL